jgi:hypothetical protein
VTICKPLPHSSVELTAHMARDRVNKLLYTASTTGWAEI